MYQRMKAPPLKAVLFDLDDTLWPIAPAIAQAENQLYAWMQENAPAVPRRFSIEQLRQRRLELMAQQPHYRLNFSALRHAALTEAFHACGEKIDAVDAAMEIFVTHRNTVALFDDVLPNLHGLRQKVMLGSVTNGVADLARIGLAEYFKTSIAAHSFGCAKPEAAIFHAACAALAIDPAEAVYVGDDLLLDIAGAKNAGLRAVWINRSGQAAHPEIVADATCADLHELHQWIDQQLLPANRRAPDG